MALNSSAKNVACHAMADNLQKFSNELHCEMNVNYITQIN